MLRDFGFLEMSSWWWVAAAAAIGIALIVAERTRALAISTLTQRDTKARAAIPGVLILTLLLATAGLVRPYTSKERIEIEVTGDDYMFVVDISQSMLAQDIPPSRISFAKRKMIDAIRNLQAKGNVRRFGITLFAGSAYLFCPLTSDTVVLKQFIDTISPGLVTSKGSNLEAGVQVAFERLQAAKTTSARILVLTDGEDDIFATERIAGLLSRHNTPVDILGIGTTEGSPISLRSGTYLRDQSGNTIISKLQEDNLKFISERTGGLYQRATLSDSDIMRLLALNTARFQSGESVTTYVEVFGEIGPWCAAAAAILLFVVVCVPSFGLRAFLPLLLASSALALTFSEAGYGQENLDQFAADPYEYYQRGEFDLATQAYEQRLKGDPKNERLRKGLASSLFKGGDPKRAAKIFHELAESATRGYDFFENKYNESNALLKAEEFEEAIKGFDEALLSKPGDERTIHNRGVAKALMEKKREQEQKKDQDAQKKQDPNAESQNSEEDKPGTSPTPAEPRDENSESNGKGAEQQGDTSGEPSPNHTDPGTPTPGATPGASSSDTETRDQPNQESERPTEGDAAPGTPTSRANQNSTPAAGLSTAPIEGTPMELPPTPGPSGDAITESAGKEGSKNSIASPSEAEAWIQSLPDSPLMLRQHGGDSDRNTGQFW